MLLFYFYCCNAELSHGQRLRNFSCELSDNAAYLLCQQYKHIFYVFFAYVFAPMSRFAQCFDVSPLCRGTDGAIRSCNFLSTYCFRTVFRLLIATTSAGRDRVVFYRCGLSFFAAVVVVVVAISSSLFTHTLSH